MRRAILKKAGVTLLAISAALCCEALLRGRAAILSRRRRSPAAGTDIDAGTAAEGIRKYAGEFDGLYESLYQAVRDGRALSTEAYEEWCDRAEQLEDEAFRHSFGRLFAKSHAADEALCREKMALLLSCVAAAGITRDRESGLSCEADESMARAYLDAEGQKPRAGARYTVVKPAWISGDRVIECGVAMPEVPGGADGREEAEQDG